MNEEPDDLPDPAPDRPLQAADPLPPDMPHIVLVAVLFEGGLAVLAWGLGWLCDFRPLQTFPTTRQAIWQGTWIGVLATVPPVIGLVLINRYPVGALADLKHVVDEMLVPLFRNVSLLGMAVIAALAGLGEEMMFRGLLQGGLAEVLRGRIGPQTAVAVALIVASLVFGLMHPITKLYAVLCFLIGLYLGAIWIWSDNLLAPIVTHGLYDFVALVYLVRAPRFARPV